MSASVRQTSLAGRGCFAGAFGLCSGIVGLGGVTSAEFETEVFGSGGEGEGDGVGEVLEKWGGFLLWRPRNQGILWRVCGGEGGGAVR